jgi:hypothetical protein
MHDVNLVARPDLAIIVACTWNEFAIVGYGEWRYWSEFRRLSDKSALIPRT